MSVIAIRWAYSRPISNPVAKNILVFLATHDFPGNRSFFSIHTICEATAYKRTAVKDGIKYLIDFGYITKNERFGNDGQQTTNQYELMINDEYVQKFCKDYELSTGGSRQTTGGESPDTWGGSRQTTTYKYNALSSKIKKSSCASPKKSTDQKRPAVNKAAPEKESPPEGHFMAGLGLSRRNENERKHEFASNMNRQAEVRSTVPFFGPGHPTWEAQQGWKKQLETEKEQYRQERKPANESGTDFQRPAGNPLEEMFLASQRMA